MTTPGPVKRWVLAARPRTLPAAAVPVVIGTMMVRPHQLNWGNAVLCLAVALALQIATNYANDYSDGIKGTDEVRVGPFRLTASKLVPSSRVRLAAGFFFAFAGVAGSILAARTSWWFIAIGVSAIAAGWFYTGGPRPYGYLGLGELFVLIYFGFVATVGTAFAQGYGIHAKAWWLGLATGMMACALLEANNLRDVSGDQLAKKRTLAARMGRKRGAWLYVACILGVVVGFSGAGLWPVSILALVLYWPELRLAFSLKEGRELLVMLKYSARAQLVLGGVTAAWFLSR